MRTFKVLTLDRFGQEVKQRLESAQQREPVFTFLVGAGFSQSVVPSTAQIVRNEWLDWYCRTAELADLDARTHRRSEVWKSFLSRVERKKSSIRDISAEWLTSETLPNFSDYEIRDAYQLVMENGFPNDRERLEFVRHILARSGMANNMAHLCLAGLLKAQHAPGWTFRSAFCHTVFTTNFDSLLQQALQLARQLYYLSDHPSLFRFLEDENPAGTHIVHTHGSLHRQFQAHTELEFHQSWGPEKENLAALKSYFEKRGVIVMGYSGWKDLCMEALDACLGFKNALFWCGRSPGWVARRKLDERVASLLERNRDCAYYVEIPQGADEAMRRLHAALGLGAWPSFLDDPLAPTIGQLESLKVDFAFDRDRAPDQDALRVTDMIVSTRRQLEDARKFLQDPQHAEACRNRVKARRHWIRAHTAALEGRWEDVIAAWTEFQQISELDPKERIMALARRGTAYSHTGAIAEAKADYDAVLAETETPKKQVLEALLQRSILHARERNNVAVAADCTRALEIAAELREEDMNMWRERAASAREKGDNRAIGVSMLGALGSAANWGKRRAEILLRLASNHADAGDLELARRDYQAVLDEVDATPEHRAVALMERAVLQKEGGEIAAALKDCEAATRLRELPAHCYTKAMFGKGFFLEQMGRKEEAIVAHSAAIDSMGDLDYFCRALINRGRLLADAGKIEEAAVDWATVIQLPYAPAEPLAKALINRGGDFYQAEDWQNALEDFEKVLKLPGIGVGEKIQAHAGIAKVTAAHQFDKAVSSLRTAIELTHENSHIRDELARRCSRPPELRAAWEAALSN